jgi:hypothetical protein
MLLDKDTILEELQAEVDELHFLAETTPKGSIYSDGIYPKERAEYFEAIINLIETQDKTIYQLREELKKCSH